MKTRTEIIPAAEFAALQARFGAAVVGSTVGARTRETLASTITAWSRTLLREDELSPDQMAYLLAQYPAYATGTPYAVGDRCVYAGHLYEVLQAHTSQSDWKPDAVPALYRRRTPINVIPEWVQPTGAHDAYKIGDRATFGGHVYESKINGNVWSPTAYPAGWTLIS